MNVVVAPPSDTLFSLASAGGSGTEVELTWPDNAVGFNVESTTNLAAPVFWSGVTNLVQTTNGVFRMFIDAAETERYFRLISP